jgi:hypothetical protein
VLVSVSVCAWEAVFGAAGGVRERWGWKDWWGRRGKGGVWSRDEEMERFERGEWVMVGDVATSQAQYNSSKVCHSLWK